MPSDPTPSVPAFRIARTRIVPVVTYRQETEVIYEGDDWLDAEEAHHAAVMDRTDGHVTFEGHHPSHRIEDTACATCGAPDNGCFAIHMPCGFDTEGKAFAIIKNEERERRARSSR